ncbi:hypothetical protein MGG_09186 [Pyricularia oryzae 70-15]|uniref:[histone H3]-trimethyl-L-lysine(9) demethylase n=1 Tax=Pyricularia oryzae (strain 70-15 / ATCC MYA-4617 / FGSC 8958) TaxID=242507 RepID=G4MPD2_PYRO7|nr:uncharacterized protein MGG_09186 [Pyricularia oryzae 70-15]EHA57186.1 hypothetical protein MGG_09186 [Pyricularia oryzae 70-15]
MSNEEVYAVANGDTIAVVPPKPTGLNSPPDSNNAMKLDGSDSELSDLDDAIAADLQAARPDGSATTAPAPTASEPGPEPKIDIGEVLPAEYSGTVPVFRPTMEQFRDFKLFMEKVNPYGMKSGIIKIVPPQEWRDSLPPIDDLVKTIRVREPIKQDIMGSNGTYRQVNVLHQRSYNLPQWRQLCDQSEHQPPARRGERRANAEKPKPAPRSKPAASATSNGTTTTTRGRPRGRRGRGGRGKSVASTRRESTVESETRPMTPESPTGEEHTIAESVENEPGIKIEEDEDDAPVMPRRMGAVSGGKGKVQSTSARRKYIRREGSAMIDEAAFKDWDYRMDISDYTPERCEELERTYWKTLTYAQPLYGADLAGTLFHEDTELWNLNKLPNLLDVLGTKVPGVNTAYLYLGMWKATFAWHLEDVDLYSINYLHFGAPKQWYSISQADARRFEAAMKNIWPTEAKACDQFLRHKAFLISPSHLQQYYNIKVNKCLSYPGEFVVTYPYGYHSGYNLGYNCAEAVNFALDSWLPMGKIAKKCECAQAQDSVWVDVYEIERKMRGESTEYEETEDEDEEDEEDDDVSMAGLPTPPSSLMVRVKARGRKRKRTGADAEDRPKVKRIRLRIRSHVEPPCCLCPNSIPGAEILPTDDGRKAHRLCALYLPEPFIEVVDNQEVIANVANIAKARLELKCLYCRSKKGACFQCSQKKCPRSYHATCAAAAGVFVEEGEVPIFGEDGTEYKEQAFEFSCRFHRNKRDKKLDGPALEINTRVRDAASALKVGETCQVQYYRGEIFAGVVAENRPDEETLLLDIIPNGYDTPSSKKDRNSRLTQHSDRVEVEWKWILVPDPSEFRLPKASPNAQPMPTSKKAQAEIHATKRAGEERPRADDMFAEGFRWAEFHTCDKDEFKNAPQGKVDLSKECQVWHYLGKTSTDLRPQYTEDLARPQHNPKSSFLESISKPTPPRRLSITSTSSAEPRRSYTPIPLPKLPPGALKTEKPYVYKPRKSIYESQFSPQTFAPKNPMPPPASPSSQPPAGSDPRFKVPSAPASSTTSAAAAPTAISGNATTTTNTTQANASTAPTPSTYVSPYTSSNATAANTARPAVGAPLGPPPPKSTWAKPALPASSRRHTVSGGAPPVPRRNSLSGVQPPARPTPAAGATPRQSKVPLPPYVLQQQQKQQQPQQQPQRSQLSSVAQKYAFFQVNHNRDSSRYRTPYATWGGFTNGYEGSLQRQLMISTTRARSRSTVQHRRGNSFNLGGGLTGLTKPARHLNYSDTEDSLDPMDTFKFPMSEPSSVPNSVPQSPSSISLDFSMPSPHLTAATAPSPTFPSLPDTSLTLFEPWDSAPSATSPMFPSPQYGSMWQQPFIGPLSFMESMSHTLGPLGSMGLGPLGPMGSGSQVGSFGGSADVVFTTPAMTMNPTTPPPMSPLTQHVPSTPPGSRGSQFVSGTPSVPTSPGSSVTTSHHQTPEQQLRQQLRRISDPPQSPYRFRCLNQPRSRHRSRSSLSGFNQLQGQILNLYPSLPNNNVPSST